MRGGNDMGVLAIPFDLCGAREPVAKADRRLRGGSEVPTVHKAVHRTGCQNIRVVRGEVDVGNGAGMCVKYMLNWRLWSRQLEVPH